jgi:D-aminopeptidase
MTRAKKQLYVLCDMEGASGISPSNVPALFHGSELWQSEGRGLVTSDVRAVCEAANEFGIDEIVLNDEHDYGKREPNVRVKELPRDVRIARRPSLPGRARKMIDGEPYGIVLVGQHAMYGGGGFAPHTIQSRVIAEVTLNGLRVGEIGLELALFMGAKLLAVVGEEAAVAEAKALCPHVVGVPVKSLEKEWFPPASETFPVIKAKVLEALRQRDAAEGLHFEPPYRFTLRVAGGYVFDPKKRFPLRGLARLIFFGMSKGRLTETEASWETKTIVRSLYALQCARLFARKQTQL